MFFSVIRFSICFSDLFQCKQNCFQCKHTSYVLRDVAVILGTSTTSSMWSMFVHHVVWWPNMAVIKYSIKYSMVWYRWPIDSSISSCLCVSPQSWRPGAELIMPAHLFSLSIVQGWVGGQLKKIHGRQSLCIHVCSGNSSSYNSFAALHVVERLHV